MNRYLRGCISRWMAGSVIAGMLAMSALFLSSTPLFAAACNPGGAALDATSAAQSCDMSITAQVNPGLLTLSNDASATVAGSPFTLSGANIAGTFTFTSVVKDHRGSTSGWALAAASAGLVNGSVTIPINLTAADAASSCTNGTCPATTFVAVSPLTTTAATFLHTAHGTLIDGDYTNKTDGTFTIPAGSPSGSYAGTITVTLSNSF